MNKYKDLSVHEKIAVGGAMRKSLDEGEEIPRAAILVHADGGQQIEIGNEVNNLLLQRLRNQKAGMLVGVCPLYRLLPAAMRVAEETDGEPKAGNDLVN